MPSPWPSSIRRGSQAITATTRSAPAGGGAIRAGRRIASWWRRWRRSTPLRETQSHYFESGPPGLFRRWQRPIENALARGTVVGKLASIALRVALGALQRHRVHAAARRPWRKPDGQNMVGHIQCNPRRQPLENLIDLVRHGEFAILWHGIKP